MLWYRYRKFHFPAITAFIFVPYWICLCWYFQPVPWIVQHFQELIYISKVPVSGPALSIRLWFNHAKRIFTEAAPRAPFPHQYPANSSAQTVQLNRLFLLLLLFFAGDPFQGDGSSCDLLCVPLILEYSCAAAENKIDLRAQGGFCIFRDHQEEINIPDIPFFFCSSL